MNKAKIGKHLQKHSCIIVNDYCIIAEAPDHVQMDMDADVIKLCFTLKITKETQNTARTDNVTNKSGRGLQNHS